MSICMNFKFVSAQYLTLSTSITNIGFHKLNACQTASAGCCVMFAHGTYVPFGRFSERLDSCSDWQGIGYRRFPHNASWNQLYQVIIQPLCMQRTIL